MTIIKITNLIQENGQADYKGLDLSKIKAGTQLYPDYDNVAYFYYDGEVAKGEDVSVVTQGEYNEHKERIENAPKPPTEVDLIKKQVADLEYMLMMNGVI